MQDSDFDPEGSDDDSDIGLAPQQEGGSKSEQVRKVKAGSNIKSISPVPDSGITAPAENLCF